MNNVIPMKNVISEETVSLWVTENGAPVGDQGAVIDVEEDGVGAYVKKQVARCFRRDFRQVVYVEGEDPTKLMSLTPIDGSWAAPEHPNELIDFEVAAAADVAFVRQVLRAITYKTSHAFDMLSSLSHLAWLADRGDGEYEAQLDEEVNRAFELIVDMEDDEIADDEDGQ